MFIWNDDNSVCFRIIDVEEGKCTDTGTWKTSGNVLCFELSFWGKSYEENKGCYTIETLGDGEYQTLWL